MSYPRILTIPEKWNPTLSGPSSTTTIIEHKSYARIALLGNPSDVYCGKTISPSLGNFSAEVKLKRSDELNIQPYRHHDLAKFQIVKRLETEGYYGGVRLLMTISLSGDIAKRTRFIFMIRILLFPVILMFLVRVSGSSAFVSANLNCLLDFYKVRHLIKVEVRPNLVLSVENELGIVAGFQDWDFSKEHMDKLGHGIYKRMDANHLLPLHLFYAENSSDSGKAHNTVRQGWLNDDKFIISSMSEVTSLAMSMFGDNALGPLNIKTIEVARSVGAAAKFTGSGGAFVLYRPDGPSQVKRLEDAWQQVGFIVKPVKVMSSFLSEADPQTLPQTPVSTESHV
ncbi:LOW QUALITY PROTEIN: hypothetical protein RJ641_022655 [Dillenia turbinata]|uniref:GHMP kinase C-terminal domain-containing protein n=1 Tax=Dillenia turbinata TaxID=194707 RepID=A0AAN8UI10_9MAGN